MKYTEKDFPQSVNIIAVESVLAGEVGRLSYAFFWDSTPQGREHWSKTALYAVLTDADREYLEWVVEWSAFRDRYKGKFPGQFTPQHVINVLNGVRMSLYHAFIWSETPQGHKYWGLIAAQMMQRNAGLPDDAVQYLEDMLKIAPEEAWNGSTYVTPEFFRYTPTSDPFEHAEALAVAAVEKPELEPEYRRVTAKAKKLEGTRPAFSRKSETQLDKMLKHMRRTGSITQREAYMDYGVQSFHRRIADLRQLGYRLRGEPRVHPTSGQSYTRYFLEE